MEGGVPSAGRHSRQTHSRVSRGKVCQRRRDRGPGGLDHRSQAGEEFRGGEKDQIGGERRREEEDEEEEEEEEEEEISSV